MSNLEKSIAEALFRPIDGETTLADEKARGVLFEQYKLYVEMADRVSTRRQHANTFSLSINTGLIAFLGFAQTQTDNALRGDFLFVVAVAGAILNYAWYRIVRSYRDLNTAKFLVIHEIEKRLVISPFDAEWEAVGRGTDKKRYLPFTHIEIWVPWVFLGIYALIFLRGLPWDRLLASLGGS